MLPEIVTKWSRNFHGPTTQIFYLKDGEPRQACYSGHHSVDVVWNWILTSRAREMPIVEAGGSSVTGMIPV